MNFPQPRRRRFVAAVSIAGVVIGLGVVAHLPVTTKQGVNYEVSTHRLPLYVKGLQFIDRDVQYQQLAAEVAGSAPSDEARLLAIFEWTRRNIRPTPDGWPVVDDHILNIVIRGHGVRDQQADVFAMLATYAGVPAFWSRMELPSAPDSLILAFARVKERWVVLDIANGLVFRNVDGGLATAEELAAGQCVSPELNGLKIGTSPYLHFLEQLRTPPVPKPLRAELQMLGPRLWYEAKRAVGFEHDDGLER